MEYRVENIQAKEMCGGGGGGGDGGGGGGGGPFLDRSKVRILLCDNDTKSCEEVFSLLCKCSYQVTAVRTPREVIDTINSEGSDIDIILTEVDLPIAKGLKMLKYIMRDKESQRIPIIMMSAKDEVSVVVKCLKLGAADYLVKPLRTNELLNLWTHMWRRRNMLGLAEKKILNCDFDLIGSDHSDANTNSTTIFSDDTDDKSHMNTIPNTSVSNHLEEEFKGSPSLLPLQNSLEPVVASCSDQMMGQILSWPKKSKLRIGESSAFFTYVKSKFLTSNPQKIGCVDQDLIESEQPKAEDVLPSTTESHRSYHQSTEEHGEIYSKNGVWNSGSTTIFNEVTSIPPPELPQRRTNKEENSNSNSNSMILSQQSNNAKVEAPALPPFPYYFPGMTNQMMMQSSTHLYHGNPHNFPNHHSSSSMLPLPQYHPLQQHCPPPHVSMMTPFPYYPMNFMQQGQIPPTTQHGWPSIAGNSSSSKEVVKPAQVERREAALIKFRQKRKDLCFDKKIRYVNRKKLAERRQRVRGQFVRQVNGVEVDLNGQPTTVDVSDEDVEDD